MANSMPLAIRRHSALLLCLSAAAASLSWAPTAGSYCRTTTCDPAEQDCDPPVGETCTLEGIPLAWPVACVGYSLGQEAPPWVPFDTFSQVTRTSFDAWEAAVCPDGQRISLAAMDLGPVVCDRVEYNQRAGNANIIVFRLGTWPYEDTGHTLALTTVTFNTQSGDIYDVDMELNAANIAVTTGDDNVAYDLQSIVTHEIGHFLGLSHSSDDEATMYRVYGRGSTKLRTLEGDDVEGICSIYPAGRTVGACDPAPRHGFQSTCGEPAKDDDDGCSVANAGARGSRGWAWPLLVGALAWRLARRRQGTRG